jgi:hypothetical protein
MNPNRSIREFVRLPEKQRHGFDCVMGHGAVELIPWCHPRSTAVTVIREPIERLVSLYQFLIDHPDLHYHPIAKCKSFGHCCQRIDQFRNYYSRWLKLDRMRYVFLSPQVLLRSFGIDGEIQRMNASTPREISESDLAIARKENAADLRLFAKISEGARMGVYSARG